MALLITLGLVLEIAGLLDARQLLAITHEYAQHWWFIPLLILAQIILYTFALAGFVFLRIVAPLYDPLMATFILAVGGAPGGPGAYLFSGYLTGEWKTRLKNSRRYKLLQAQDNFLSLFVMLVFPGSRHALSSRQLGAWLDIDMKNTWYILRSIDVVFINSRDVCFYPKNMQDVKP